MRINTNIMALNAQNKLTVNQGNVEKSIQKLSSGLKINGAADDAAGLAISEKMRAQIRGLDQAEANAQDSISLLQTAEGALQQTTDILQRMRELVVKSQNTGVLTDEDRTSIANEMSTLRDEIDRIATSTTFNGKKLLNGDLGVKLAKSGSGTTATIAGVNNIDVSNALASASFKVSMTASKLTLELADETGTYKEVGEIDISKLDTISGKMTFDGKTEDGEVFKLSIDFDEKKKADWVDLWDDADRIIKTSGDTERAEFKIGANYFSEDTLAFGIGNMSSEGLNRDMNGGRFDITLGERSISDKTLIAIDYALDKVASQRASIGTMQNRMEYAITNLSTTSENLTAAESRIRDVDMADEMVKYTKDSILNQSAMAMLAQANQQPQAILSLLQ